MKNNLTDSEFQEELLSTGILQQVNNILDKLDTRPKKEYKGDSYRFIILDLTDDKTRSS